MSDPRNALRNLGGVVDARPTGDGLPGVPPVEHAGLFSFLQAVKNWISSATSGANRLVTLGDLAGAGIGEVNELGELRPSSQDDFTPPPAPTNVQVASNVGANMVVWDPPVGYRNFAFAEVWRGVNAEMTNAVYVGETASAVYLDQLTSRNDIGASAFKTYYYKVRFVSKAGVKGGWNASLGISATADLIDNSFIGNLWASKIVFDRANGNTFSANVINGESIFAANLGAIKASLGIVRIDSTGYLYTNGVTSYSAGSGVFLGYDSGLYKFRVGESVTGNQFMGWDGVNLTVKSPQFSLVGGNATFMGSLDVKSATSGARMEVKNSVIKVFDTNGVLRVKIGDLSA